MELPNKPLLDVADVLPFFNVVENTFRTWIKRNQLPEGLIFKIGNTVKIRRNVLEQVLKGN